MRPSGVFGSYGVNVNENDALQRCRRHLHEKAQWHTCVAYGPIADHAAKIQAGTHVFLEGELIHCEYDRTIETESGPVKVQWPMTEIVRVPFRSGSPPEAGTKTIRVGALVVSRTCFTTNRCQTRNSANSLDDQFRFVVEPRRHIQWKLSLR